MSFPFSLDDLLGYSDWDRAQWRACFLQLGLLPAWRMRMSEQGWHGFLAAEGVDDWVVLHGQMEAP